MEPLPKQGCEDAAIACRAFHTIRLSGTPAEAGVRGHNDCFYDDEDQVSVEPLPKQGCENSPSVKEISDDPGLSGTPAEAGVRDIKIG